MRSKFLLVCAVASVLVGASASANAGQPLSLVPPAAVGVAVGTVAGVGTYYAWWGSSAAAVLPASAAGAAAVGGVAGIGTVALIDAALQPCKGFHALVGANRGYCAAINGY